VRSELHVVAVQGFYLPTVCDSNSLYLHPFSHTRGHEQETFAIATEGVRGFTQSLRVSAGAES
jgi:hypothetical protein